jgi:flagellar hook-associated protein 1
MTTLSSALSQALSGLRVSSAQSALAARNISRANEENYTRKHTVLTTDVDGSARIESYARNAEKKLLDTYNTSLSNASGLRTILAALEQLQETVGDVSDEKSLASEVARLQDHLKASEANPNDRSIAAVVTRTATNLSEQLNSISADVDAVRSEADRGLKNSVASINDLLTKLQELNARITKTIQSDQEQAEALDSRDAVLKSLAAEVGIRTVAQENNGISVYTDGGVTLFNQVARKVTFTQVPAISASSIGNAVYIDGVPIVGPGAQMPSQSGKLAGFSEVRDRLAPQYQAQLDEMARGLIFAFAERDQTLPPSQPDASGLFGFAGGPALPTGMAVITGLASSIRVNPAFDPQQGGNPMFLRDGGANGPNFLYNPNGDAGFQTRLTSLVAAMDSAMSFAPATGLAGTSSLKDFAAESSGWLAAQRADVNEKSQYHDAMETRTKDALQRTVGVNIDDEMSAMLNLERSYQASAKIISVVDQMFKSLLEAVR